MKLDVEGAEYELLEHLVARDAMRLVDWLAVEWHLGQRAPRKGPKRTNIEMRQDRLERHLRDLGVRRFVWEDLATSWEVVLGGGPAPGPKVGANTTTDLSGSCVGSPRMSRCCKRHPKATGCRRSRVAVRSGYGRHSTSRAFV